jgi:hypothetical protein
MTQSHTCPQARPEREVKLYAVYDSGIEIEHGKTKPVCWIPMEVALVWHDSGAVSKRTERGTHFQFTGHKIRCNGGQLRDASATMNEATMFKLAGMPDSPFKRRILNAWKN